jgi:hypothetical protein
MYILQVHHTCWPVSSRRQSSSLGLDDSNLGLGATSFDSNYIRASPGVRSSQALAFAAVVSSLYRAAVTPSPEPRHNPSPAAPSILSALLTCQARSGFSPRFLLYSTCPGFTPQLLLLDQDLIWADGPQYGIDDPSHNHMTRHIRQKRHACSMFLPGFVRKCVQRRKDSLPSRWVLIRSVPANPSVPESMHRAPFDFWT